MTVNPVAGHGVPLWAMTPTSMNLFMKDIPLWYTPPYGPAVEFRMSYNSLDTTSRPADFGPKWNLNYHSFCVCDDLYQIVDVYMPDGGIYPYETNTITGGYIAPARSFNTLTNLVDGGYQLTFPDGTIYTYTQQNSLNTSQWLLTQVTDRYGQTLTLHYADDPVWGTQLISVEDALSQSSTLEYNDAGLIQSITDPFGRSTTMDYDYSKGGMDGALDYIKRIKRWLPITDVYIWDHGGQTIGQLFGGKSLQELDCAKQKMAELGSLTEDDGTIQLMGCYIGNNAALLQQYANAFGRPVWATRWMTSYRWPNDVMGIYRIPFTLETKNPQ